MLFPRNLFTEVLGGDNFASTTLIEFLQLFTTRSFSYYDLFYNAIGIAVGVIFYKLLMLIIINSSVFFKKVFN